MTIYRLKDIAPELPASAWIAPNATVVGDVRFGERTSVWFGAVVRGDNEAIEIGDETNVQEGCVLHADPGFPLRIGKGVTIGHQAMVHGCTIGAGSLIGIQAVVLNGAVIGEHSLVGAGAIVTEGKVFPPRSLILGAPAKVVKELDDAAVQRLVMSAASYVERAARFRVELVSIDPDSTR